MMLDAPERFSVLVPHLPDRGEAEVHLITAYNDVYTFTSAPVQHPAHNLLLGVLTPEDEREDISDTRLRFVREAAKELGVRLSTPDRDEIRDLI
jgi:hypothetical protein